MMGFVISAAIIAIIAFLIWLTFKAADGSVLAGFTAIGTLVVVLGLMVNAIIKEDEKGPCHQYETRWMYNAATKTMMPSRVCVLRGEWVEEHSNNQ